MERLDHLHDDSMHSLRSPVRQYRLHGDERPSKRRLEKYVNELSDHKKPATLIVVADMLIDLAMRDTKHTPEHLANANAKLAVAAQRARQLPNLTHLAIRARMHRAELAAWGQAAREEEIDVSYYHYLSAAADAAQYPGYSQKDRTAWAKHVPLLLGARALDRGIGGWAGRSALAREAGFSDGTYDSDWSFAVILSPTPDNFDDPPLKLQLINRVSQSESQRQYFNRPTLLSNIRQLQLGAPLRTVHGCLDEIDCLPDHVNPDKVFNSGTLDRIAGNMLIATA